MRRPFDLSKYRRRRKKETDPLLVVVCSAWEASFKDHLKGQTELLAEVGKGVMTPELDAKLKKTVQECVFPLPCSQDSPY